jgi:hypothetical protein
MGVYMEPRGRWAEKVWEPLVYRINAPNFAVRQTNLTKK